AEILGRLDDKIELNRRINTTLETMAQSLYKHWFVDFGPFQDGQFVESELGLIPKGWEVASVYSLANYLNGMAVKPKQVSDNPNDGLPVIKIRELRQGGTTSGTGYFLDDYKPKYELKTGDILFAWSASLGIYLWTGGKALLNQHIFNVTPNGTLPKSVIYFMLHQTIDEFVSIAAARATTMGHIKKSHLQEKLIALPPKEVIALLEPKLTRIYQLLVETEKESRHLATTRDYLLPRLLSGKLAVKETV
ncbi:restriction endonuclease subunit S, partial [Anaerolineales bacterium HSG25]|nr:restriction endonuclease subunit S [Anaerolineales bacterium HSG25]